MKHISCITCFAFDKSFILEDFLQEATNWQFLSQLGPETLRLAGFSGHHYFHTFYKYLAIQILQFYDFSLMDFQDIIISTHFTNIIRAKYCGFMSSSSYEILISSYGMFINRTNSNIYIALWFKSPPPVFLRYGIFKEQTQICGSRIWKSSSTLWMVWVAFEVSKSKEKIAEDAKFPINHFN